MACPFKLSISVFVLILAVLSALFHIYLSDTTLDYILQFVPLPESWKDWLYLKLSINMFEDDSILEQNNILQSQKNSIIINNEQNKGKNEEKRNKNNINPTQTHYDTMTETISQSSSDFPSSETASNPNLQSKQLKIRPKRQFLKADTPKIIFFFKYVVMALLVYFHIELIFYQFTNRCFAATVVRLFTGSSSDIIKVE
jgi:hypothetical protein